MRLFGLLATLVYLALVVVITVLNFQKFLELSPNEWGDFLAGVFGPLALFWVVLGFFQQGRELQNSVNALNLQAKELAESVEQQKEIAKISREQISSQRELEDARRERQLRKCRAALARALSEMHDECEVIIRTLVDPCKARPVVWERFAAALLRIEDIVELSDVQIARHFAQISTHYQIYTARSKRLIESDDLRRAKPDENCVCIDGTLLFRSDYIIQWAEFRCLIDSCYDYARFKSEEISKTEFVNNDICHVLFNEMSLFSNASGVVQEVEKSLKQS